MAQTETCTAEEYEEMGALTSDLIHAAIDSGDAEKAHALLDRLVEESRGIHDSYLLWLTGMQSFIYREMGFEAFQESQVETFAHTAKAFKNSALPADASFRDRVMARAAMMRTHATPLAIEEDAEKVTFQMNEGCASGARLLNMGFFEEGVGGEMIKGPRPLTFNREELPAYCTHCALQQIPSVAAGKPLTVTTVPDQDLKSGLCKFHLYKPGNHAPESHVATLREDNDGRAG